MLVLAEEGVQDAQRALQVAVHDVVRPGLRLLDARLLHEEEGKVDVLQLLLVRRHLQRELVERHKVALQQAHEQDQEDAVLQTQVWLP